MMDEMTACLQENMELYAENERLYKLVARLKIKVSERKKRNDSKDKRKQEMIVLRDERNWTLQEIADEYGISRERVRQIVGNSGHENKKHTRRKKAALMHPDLTNGEIADILDINEATVSVYRRGTRHAISNKGFIGQAVEKENQYGELLENMGMSVELMPHRHPFDALVNGWRIDFKYCKTQHRPPSMHDSPNNRWRFHVRKGKEQREKCDFYFCITDNDDVFIIPSKEVPDTMQSLIFSYPSRKYKLSKWQSYLDRYDLLQTPKQEGR